MIKELTPMGRLSSNLRTLKAQLNENFNIIELQTRASESKCYKGIEKKEIKSDYMLLFVNNYNRAINFAFVFWYKDLDENNWLIDITTKNTDGNIVFIKQFSFNKFKEVLNNLVKLNIDSNSIFDYILLLKNIKDDYIDDIEKRNEIIISELRQIISDKLESKKELEIMSINISNKLQHYFDIVEKSETYKENHRLRKELDESNGKLLEFRQTVFRDLKLQQLATTFDKKITQYNITLKKLYDNVHYKLDKRFRCEASNIINEIKFIPNFKISLFELARGIIENYSGYDRWKK